MHPIDASTQSFEIPMGCFPKFLLFVDVVLVLLCTGSIHLCLEPKDGSLVDDLETIGIDSP